VTGARAARCALAFALPLAAQAAQAQWGGSVVFASDDRFRGISLTQEKPSWRLSLSYDGASGAYAGASLATVRPRPGMRRASLTSFAGFTAPLGALWRWDAGATYTHEIDNARWNYGEAHAGLSGNLGTFRLSYSPNYYGAGAATLYAEFDTTWPLSPAWHALLHAGALRRRDGEHGVRVDLRLGAVLHAAGADWQLAWVGATREGPYAVSGYQHASRIVASVAVGF
jgi:uncharacterized protein (TIGR02001 family)